MYFKLSINVVVIFTKLKKERKLKVTLNRYYSDVFCHVIELYEICNTGR